MKRIASSLRVGVSSTYPTNGRSGNRHGPEIFFGGLLEPVRVQVVFGHPLQPDAVDLAGRVERHLLEEEDLLRGLVADPLAAVDDQVAGARALGGAGDGGGPDIERLGVSTDDVRSFALDGLTRRLDIIGVPLSSL
jgi:hypothetical protein